MVEKRIHGRTKPVTNSGTDKDIDSVQCSWCGKSFKSRGLRIHQAKKGCKEHLSDSQRNTSKSEATSTRDSNHSDARDRVRLKTTHRGSGAQKMETLGKVSKEKNMGNSCWEGGNVVAEVRRKKVEERKVKSDIRNWFMKNEPENIPEEEKVGHVEGSSENPVDLIDETSQEVNLEKMEDGAPIIDWSKEISSERVVRTTIKGQVKGEKMDIRRGPGNEKLSV